MPHGRRCGGELDTATRARLLVIGSVTAVFMGTALTLAVIVVPGNNVVLHGPVNAAEKALLAVDGIDVGGPDQWPDDGQNPSYTRQKVLCNASPTIAGVLSGLRAFASGVLRKCSSPGRLPHG